jgi:hypothetical protein
VGQQIGLPGEARISASGRVATVTGRPRPLVLVSCGPPVARPMNARTRCLEGAAQPSGGVLHLGVDMSNALPQPMLSRQLVSSTGVSRGMSVRSACHRLVLTSVAVTSMSVTDCEVRAADSLIGHATGPPTCLEAEISRTSTWAVASGSPYMLVF